MNEPKISRKLSGYDMFLVDHEGTVIVTVDALSPWSDDKRRMYDLFARYQNIADGGLIGFSPQGKYKYGDTFAFDELTNVRGLVAVPVSCDRCSAIEAANSRIDELHHEKCVAAEEAARYRKIISDLKDEKISDIKDKKIDVGFWYKLKRKVIRLKIFFGFGEVA